jgi:hypothetical protein
VREPRGAGVRGGVGADLRLGTREGGAARGAAGGFASGAGVRAPPIARSNAGPPDGNRSRSFSSVPVGPLVRGRPKTGDSFGLGVGARLRDLFACSSNAVTTAADSHSMIWMSIPPVAGSNVNEATPPWSAVGLAADVSSRLHTSARIRRRSPSTVTRSFARAPAVPSPVCATRKVPMTSMPARLASPWGPILLSASSRKRFAAPVSRTLARPKTPSRIRAAHITVAPNSVRRSLHCVEAPARDRSPQLR